VNELQVVYYIRILDYVGSGVSGQQRDCDNETSGRESKQHEYEQLAFPTRKGVLEHGDRTVTVRAFCSDTVIHRQSAEERE
jgi:hypothetical protein